MSSTALKANFYYLVPYGLIVLGIMLSGSMAPIVGENKLISYTPYLLCGSTVLLALHFNRGRALLAATLLGAVYLVMQSQHLIPAAIAIKNPLILLFSLALMVLALVKEQGVLTVQTYWLTALFTVLFVVAGWIVIYPPAWLGQWLDHDLITLPTGTAIHLTQPVILILLAAATLLFWLWQRRRAPLNNALLVVLLAVAISVNAERSVALMVIMFSLGGLILLVSLIQDSYHMAYRDELTGLMGRRAFNEALTKLGRRYVIAMLDVDKFKKFNDTYGHDVGDQVLKMVAAHLNKATGGARAYRYGGEEFSLIFPHKSLKQVQPHLETLRAAIADYAMSIRGPQRPNRGTEGKKQRSGKKGKEQVRVTISIGAAQRDNLLKAPEQVIKAADQSLYQAKRKGRNRVICTPVS